MKTKKTLTTNAITDNLLTNIKWLRKRQKVTQEELSSALQYTPSNYAKIENGRTKLTIIDLVHISIALKCTCSLLFKDHNDFVFMYNNYRDRP